MAQPQLEASHDDLIDITLTFAPAGVTGATLTTVLALEDDITPGGGLVAEYTSSAQVAADVLAGNLTATSQRIADIMFAQNATQSSGRVERMLFGQVDLTGGDTAPQGLDAVIATGAQFYGVVYASRTAARQVALAVDIEAKTSDNVYLLLGLQSDDADWWTAGHPAAWTGIEGLERTALYFHDNNVADATGDYLDAAHFANRLSFSPDQFRAQWNSSVQSVAALSPGPDTAQKEFARDQNFANLALPWGTVRPTYVQRALTQNGRPVEHIVSADWLRVRMQEAVADLIGEVADRGGTLAVSLDGQVAIGTAIEAVMITGETIGHFLAHSLIYEPITDADRAAQRVRYSGSLQWSTGVREVRISLFFDQDAII